MTTAKSSLVRVTITGADDRTDACDLVLLSRRFPFVEWGVLYSTKREGQPRYPRRQWMDELADAARGQNVAIALHYCGGVARAALDGELLAIPMVDARRIQLNGWSGIDDDIAALRRWTRLANVEFILQCRSRDMLQRAADDARAIGSASVLWDPSGGRGIGEFGFPVAPQGCRLGYAGGISPDNVLDVLGAIGPVEHPFWIDMESRVRTDDVLDLAKVERVLSAVAPHVEIA